MILKRKETVKTATGSSCCSSEAIKPAIGSSCCSHETIKPATGSSCCNPEGKAAGLADGMSTEKPTRQIKIDFLYLDLAVCTRCQGADTTLEEAIADVSTVLRSAGIEVLLNKVNILTEELATQYRFVSSPTIRIDGRDIALDVKESLCESCGDLCGDTVDCRVWTWQGEEYNTPPKAMIVNAILQAVYGAPPPKAPEGQASSNLEPDGQDQPFKLPENLKHFYEIMRRKDA